MPNLDITEEWLVDVLDGSMEMDWTTADGARAIMRALEASFGYRPPSGDQGPIAVGQATQGCQIGDAGPGQVVECPPVHREAEGVCLNHPVQAAWDSVSTLPAIASSEQEADALAAALARPHYAVAPAGDGVVNRRYALEWRNENTGGEWKRIGGGFEVPGNRHSSRHLTDREEALREMAKVNARWVDGTDHRVVMIEETPVGFATDKGHHVVTEPAALARPRAAVGEREASPSIDELARLIDKRAMLFGDHKGYRSRRFNALAKARTIADRFAATDRQVEMMVVLERVAMLLHTHWLTTADAKAFRALADEITPLLEGIGMALTDGGYGFDWEAAQEAAVQRMGGQKAVFHRLALQSPPAKVEG